MKKQHAVCRRPDALEVAIGKTQIARAATARDRELQLRELWPRLEAVIGRRN